MFPELSTQRFLLKEILLEDQHFIFEGLSHPQVIPFYGVRYDSFESTRKQMDFYKELYKNQTGIWWKITARSSKEKLGAIGFNNWSHAHRKAEIGYWLFPNHWKKGIIAEVLPAVVKLMHQKGIHRIEALVEEENQNSARVLEHEGFVYEGKMRDCEWKFDRYISLRIYSLLASDNLHS
jgi:[ribosomal protein S5]-alanine N-acetyltransferase